MLKLLIVFALVAATFIEDNSASEQSHPIIKTLRNLFAWIRGSSKKTDSESSSMISSSSSVISSSSSVISSSSSMKSKSSSASSSFKSSPMTRFNLGSSSSINTQDTQLEVKIPPINRRYSTSDIPNHPLEIRLPDTAQPRPDAARPRAFSISEGLSFPKELPYVTMQNFTFEYFIAEGGYSKIFLVAFQDGFGREYKYAMKICYTQYARDYDKKHQRLEEFKTGTLGRLIGELQVLIAVNESPMTRPWVTQLKFAFRHEDLLCYVMEFIPGGELTDVLQMVLPATRSDRFGALIIEYYIDVKSAWIILSQLVVAVHTLHRAGFVHRDLRWPNILVGKDGYIKLSDFGYAVKLSDDASAKKQNDKLIKEDRHMIHNMIGVFILRKNSKDPPEKQSIKYLTQQHESMKSLQKAIYDTKKKSYANLILDDVRDHEFFRGVDWDQVADRKSNRFLVEPLEITKKVNFDVTNFKRPDVLSSEDKYALKDFYYVAPCHQFDFRKNPPPVELVDELANRPANPSSLWSRFRKSPQHSGH